METNDFMEAMQQEAPIKTNKHLETLSGVEKTLRVLADIILVCGGIATIICAFSIIFIRNRIYEIEFNPTGFAITISILAGTLIIWSTMRVLANISITLKEILKKIK